MTKITTSRLIPLAAATISFGALFALTYFVYGRVLEIRPLSGDNLYILAWADRAPATALFAGDPDFYPEWRPLPYSTVWLQYRWSNLHHVEIYYLINLLLWSACGWLVYRVVVRLGHSAAGGLLAAGILITDSQPVFAVSWIIERQSSMACIFGLLAMLIVLKPRERPLTRAEWGGASLLLLAAALSKEYGLAFAGAVAVFAIGEQRDRNLGGRRTAATAIAAVVVYIALRAGFAPGAMTPLCEEMGYFFRLRRVCYQPLDATGISQVIYNIVSAGTDSVLHGLFTGDGQIRVAPSLLSFSVVWLALALIGWAKGDRQTRLTVLLLGFNAVLNFMLYRERNHLIGLCAFAVAAGVGMSIGSRMLRTRRWALVVAALVLPGLLVGQTIRTSRVVSSVVDQELHKDPCESLTDIPHLDAEFVRRVKDKYDMTNPDCVGAR